ncbi:DUF6327 family protein [Robertkochia solimangrovi]|uniref:DUF6327 family protein n=1 Tax=Robertkochia solimangrovi TaxID=2213046 RepID=UPI00118149C5|nr:DUF6327 family protein [Robertkochia solimangrovi]TRZ46055.1 hypothetical protein DMZ48_01940 [Robertkochia solimangrovi]
MKIYTSFEDVDRDLKILKLKKEIQKEQLKLSINEAKENFSFMGVVGKSAGFVIKRILTLKLINKLFK